MAGVWSSLTLLMSFSSPSEMGFCKRHASYWMSPFYFRSLTIYNGDGRNVRFSKVRIIRSVQTSFKAPTSFKSLSTPRHPITTAREHHDSIPTPKTKLPSHEITRERRSNLPEASFQPHSHHSPIPLNHKSGTSAQHAFSSRTTVRKIFVFRPVRAPS